MLLFRLGSMKTFVEADWEGGSNFCCKITAFNSLPNLRLREKEENGEDEHDSPSV